MSANIPLPCEREAVARACLQRSQKKATLARRVVFPLSSILLSLTTIFLVGCGQPEPEVVFIPAPHVTVIGLDGEKKTIPSAELYDPSTGEPTVESVLVIDRATNRKVFVGVDRLGTESQADARYILVPESQRDSPMPAEGYQ